MDQPLHELKGSFFLQESLFPKRRSQCVVIDEGGQGSGTQVRGFQVMFQIMVVDYVPNQILGHVPDQVPD